MLIRAIIFSLLLFFPVEAMAAPNLCSEGEVVVFNCSAGKKLISVCASRDISRTSGYLQYRFGTLAKTELSVPANTTPAPGTVVPGDLMFSGGGGTYLRFKTADISYTVYTAVSGSWGDKDGVAIDRAGKRISHLSCTDAPTIDKFNSGFFEKAGLTSEGYGEFDLP